MHTTRTLGDVGNETGPRVNAVKRSPLTQRDFHIGTGLTTRKNTKVRLLAKGKPKRLSGRRCTVPEKPAAIRPNALKFSKGRKWLTTAFFSDQKTTWAEGQDQTGASSTLEVMDL
jgi:hypothetical protein